MNRSIGRATKQLLLTCILGSLPTSQTVASSLQTTVAPVFELQGINQQVSLEDFRGSVVYLDFWASWCAPCLRSFPWMNELQARHEAAGLKVIAINLDADSTDATKFLEATRPNFVIAYDPTGQTAVDYSIRGMPSSYLIARDGTVSWQHIGFRAKDIEKLEKQVVAELEEGL
ncbi:MAG: TlpA disulfide reductase family protein [Granulosicoccus sp.]